MNRNVAIGVAKITLHLLALAGFLLAKWLVPAIGEALGIGDTDTAWRAAGILFGIYCIVTGNQLPKGQLVPASSESATDIQGFLRFLGWTYVLGGIALVLALLVLPVATAFTVLKIAAPVVIFAATLRIALRKCQRKREQRAIQADDSISPV